MDRRLRGSSWSTVLKIITSLVSVRRRGRGDYGTHAMGWSTTVYRSSRAGGREYGACSTFSHNFRSFRAENTAPNRPKLEGFLMSNPCCSGPAPLPTQYSYRSIMSTTARRIQTARNLSHIMLTPMNVLSYFLDARLPWREIDRCSITLIVEGLSTSVYTQNPTLFGNWTSSRWGSIALQRRVCSRCPIRRS